MDAVGAPVDHRHGPLPSRASAVVVALIVGIVVDLVLALAEAREAGVLSRVVEGRSVSDAEITSVETTVGAVALVNLIVFIVTVVLWIRWFHRAYSNLPTLGVSDLRYKTGWAIGAWFVPILNLFRPKQIMNDIWRASDPELPDDAGGEWHGRPVPAFINWWWALFLVAGWIDQVSGRLALRDDPSEVLASAQIGVVGDLLWIPTALLAIRIVRKTTARQQQRITKVLARLPAASPTGEVPRA